jgi:hypothetical protein
LEQAVYKSFVCLTLVGVSEDEFLTAALKNWKNTTGIDGKLDKHAKLRCHTLSSERFVTAKSCAADPSKRVVVMLSEENRRLLAQTERQKQENRESVAMIIDCVRFLVKQGLAF